MSPYRDTPPQTETPKREPLGPIVAASLFALASFAAFLAVVYTYAHVAGLVVVAVFGGWMLVAAAWQGRSPRARAIRQLRIEAAADRMFRELQSDACAKRAHLRRESSPGELSDEFDDLRGERPQLLHR